MDSRNHKNKEDIATGLLEIGAIQLSFDNPFQWSSGWKSPIYCDNRMTLGHPSLREKITQGFVSLIEEKQIQVDTIAGVATGGVPYGALIADRLGLPFGYVRSSAKGHGQGKRVEGDLQAGCSCLLIEDLISTGASSIKAVIALREVGLQVDNVASIFSYGFDQANVLFQNGNCAFDSLIDYSILVDQAIQKGAMTHDQLNELESWRQNPEQWKNE